MYKKYTGWSVYHANRRPKWEYKRGTYQSRDVCFFRCVKNLVAKKIPQSEEFVFKHRVVFVCEGVNLSAATWSDMENKLKQTIRGREVVVVDLIPKLLSKRKMAVYKRCILCDAKIHSKEATAYCSICRNLKEANIKKAKLKQKAIEVANEKCIHDLLEEIKTLKLQAKESENTLLLFSKEKDKMLRDQVKIQAELAEKHRHLMHEREVQEQMQEQMLQQADLIHDMSTMIKISSESVGNTMLVYSEKQANLVLKIDSIDKTLALESKKIDSVLASVEDLRVNCKRAILNLSPSTTSPFGLSLGADIWYFGVYLCASAKRQAWGTAIERMGNIAFYNEAMVPSITQLLDTEIPIVTAVDLSGSGVDISLSKLSYVFPNLNFDYAGVDIVLNISSTSRKSLRKDRDLFFALFEIYKIEHDCKYFWEINRRNIWQLNADKYQEIFLLVYYFHLKKGQCQTFEMKDAASSPSTLYNLATPYVKGAYLSYIKYDFYNIDTVKLCFTTRHHGQGHELLPVHVQLHTYTHTYKYVWKEPRIGLENNSGSDQ
jgi:hypothetical protein